MIDWNVTIKKRWLVIGDSNLSRIPPFQIPDLQIDSFPGASFSHAEAILKKAVISSKVEKVVLAFGLNNREQRCKDTAIKQLQRTVKAAKDKLPYAEIWVPEINFSRGLPIHQQEILEGLNRYINSHTGYIPPLPGADFEVERDKIHWTADTGKAMLQHWAKQLNCIAP